MFAGKHYRPYDLVGEIDGEIIEDPDYRSDYCFNLENGSQLEPFSPFRFVNHSCEPNCYFDFLDKPGTDSVPSSRHILLFAATNIKPGDELTIDYNWNSDGAIPCRCQAPSCRGWIVNEDQVGDIIAPILPNDSDQTE